MRNCGSCRDFIVSKRVRGTAHVARAISIPRVQAWTTKFIHSVILKALYTCGRFIGHEDDNRVFAQRGCAHTVQIVKVAAPAGLMD